MSGAGHTATSSDRTDAALSRPERRHWDLDPDWITVNHGSFGACPHPVRHAAASWRDRLSRQPTRFFHADYPSLLRAAAATLAARLRVPADELAFVTNATEGVNAVLRSRRFAPDEEILLLDQAYGAVRRTVAYVAAGSGARVVDVAVPFPVTDADAVVRALASAITPRTRLAVLDHVLSPSGLVLPIAAMVAACRSAGVPVLVDGAHAPGQVALDLGAIDAEWYTGNLHKWWFAAPGTAFLHARADARGGLVPPVVSHGIDDGFVAAFDWTGTRDPAAWLATGDALAFHDRLGGASLMAANHFLARDGASRVASLLGTSAAPPCVGGGAMALARLPDRAGPATVAAALAWRERLMAARVDAPVVCLAGVLWLRLSAQAYNRIEDYEAVARAIRRLLDGNPP